VIEFPRLAALGHQYPDGVIAIALDDAGKVFLHEFHCHASQRGGHPQVNGPAVDYFIEVLIVMEE